jgi:predicted HicB family RNase H-like nuclease
MNRITYRGYDGLFEYDDEAGLFHGRVIGLRDTITFQGQSIAELKDALAGSVEAYLEYCKSRNVEPEKPYSGQLLLRLAPALHRDCAVAARLSGRSLNGWIADTLQAAVGPVSMASHVPRAVASSLVLSPAKREASREASGTVFVEITPSDISRKAVRAPARKPSKAQLA